MKTLYKIKYLFIILFTVCTIGLFAQGGPGDPGGDPEGGGGDPLGGGAPISGGVTMLIALSLIYGGKKMYELRQNKKELN